MKKIIIIIFLVTVAIESNAQFFRGIGIFVAGNSTAHRYRNLQAHLKDPNVYVPEYYYPPNHHSRDFQGYGFGLLLEFLRSDHIRWQTEFEYTTKGALERVIVDPYLGTTDGRLPNVYTYIQWNNYLKYMGTVTRKGQWYAMLGARLEYLFSFAAPVYAPVSTAFPKIWVSGDVGVGWEFFTWKKLHPFVEFHYNPDVIYHPPVQNTIVRSRTFELRIGLIFRPMPKSIDDCNAPKYHGNYY